MTIYQKLAEKLGRNPTNAECKTECLRIMNDALIEAASKGKLSHQKKRA